MRRRPAALLAVAITVAVCAAWPAAQVAPYDLLLATPASSTALAARGTAAILASAATPSRASRRPSTSQPTRTIDVAGQVVAPGFIDIHTHASRGIFQIPTADNYVRQGVTTLIEGPDGSSPVPLGPFLAKLEALQKSVNIGAFIGQGSIRSRVIGEVNRQATADELQQMRALVEQGMKDGAFGLSTGLFYVPGTFTPTDEVVELAKVAGRAGGMHISHMRDETAACARQRERDDRHRRAWRPADAGHTSQGHRPPNWGKSVETLKAVDEARPRGVDVTIDAYPYTASSTSIQGALLPGVGAGGRPQAGAGAAGRPGDRAPR